jgi:hypothetical protein
MKIVVAGLCLASFAAGLAAQEVKPRITKFPTREVFQQRAEEEALNPDRIHFARGNNLSYHNGPVVISAKVVYIFWGPTFSNVGSADWQYAQQIIGFRNQFGTNGEYNTITQYTQFGSQHIQLANLGSGTPDLFDPTPPPTAVTDANVQSEVAHYLTLFGFNSSTIYEVVIPSTSYSTDQGETSCGGPNLFYCAYHSWYTSGSSNVLYSIEPYPSCSGCQWPGWTFAQNADHFVCHETREAVTDPVGTGWWNNRTGAELDDQCAWSPNPFLSGGYGYQYEWSNANNGCVQTR